MSQGQKATVPALQHQQEAIRQGWPRASHIITNNLPPELQKEAERRHNEIVRQVNKGREDFLSSGGRKQVSASSPKMSKKFRWSDITHTAKQRGIDENEVIDKLAKQMGMGVDEFMGLVESPGN